MTLDEVLAGPAHTSREAIMQQALRCVNREREEERVRAIQLRQECEELRRRLETAAGYTTTKGES